MPLDPLVYSRSEDEVVIPTRGVAFTINSPLPGPVTQALEKIMICVSDAVNSQFMGNTVPLDNETTARRVMSEFYRRVDEMRAKGP